MRCLQAPFQAYSVSSYAYSDLKKGVNARSSACRHAVIRPTCVCLRTNGGAFHQQDADGREPESRADKQLFLDAESETKDLHSSGRQEMTSSGTEGGERGSIKKIKAGGIGGRMGDWGSN